MLYLRLISCHTFLLEVRLHYKTYFIKFLLLYHLTYLISGNTYELKARILGKSYQLNYTVIHHIYLFQQRLIDVSITNMGMTTKIWIQRQGQHSKLVLLSQSRLYLKGLRKVTENLGQMTLHLHCKLWLKYRNFSKKKVFLCAISRRV